MLEASTVNSYRTGIMEIQGLYQFSGCFWSSGYLSFNILDACHGKCIEDCTLLCVFVIDWMSMLKWY